MVSFFRFRVAVFCCLVWVLAAITLAAQPQFLPVTNFDHFTCKNKHLLQTQLAQKQNSATEAAPDKYNLTYARPNWFIDPAIRYISGNIIFYFQPLTSGFDTIWLDISSVLTVDSVQYHGQNIGFSQSLPETVQIFLPDELPLQSIDSIAIYYQGEPPSTGFGSFIQEDHSGTPIIWTLSQPYGASDWWVCKNSLTDKIDSIDILVTSPQAYRTASNGLLVSETLNGSGLRTCHWQHKHPIATYLVAIATTNYVDYTNWVELAGNTVPILNYVYPESLEAAMPLTAGMIPVIQLFDSLFIPYPYRNEKYGHAQFNWGGGMEHQTMSFVGDFGFELLAHELAHQWFGDYVTCGSWHDIWLNEGFATYLSGLCYEHLFGGMYWLPFKNIRISAITSQPDGSVWCPDTTNVNRIFNGRLSYAKGAMILHQLRWVIGDEAFFTALKNYLNNPMLANGFARSDDLIAHFEQTANQDLNWYFADWLYGEGFPSYQISWSQSGMQPPTGSNTLTIGISQTQSHPSVNFFELPLPLRITGANGETVDIRLTNEENNQIYTQQLDFEAVSVELDPDRCIITNNNTITAAPQPPAYHPANPITVYPNPAGSNVIVQTSGLPIQSLYLHNLSGQQLLAAANLNALQYTLPLTNVAAGYYLLTVFTPTGAFTQPVVKR